MKNSILILVVLAIFMLACDKKSEEQYVSYILAVDSISTGQDNAEIDVMVIGPKINIDTFYIKLHKQTAPFDSALYVFNGTQQSGKYHFSLNGLAGGNYNFFVYATTFDGKYSRYARTQDKLFTITML